MICSGLRRAVNACQRQTGAPLTATRRCVHPLRLYIFYICLYSTRHATITDSTAIIQAPRRAPHLLQQERMPRPLIPVPLGAPWPPTRQGPRVVEAYFASGPVGGQVREVVLYTLSLGALQQPVARLELMVQPAGTSTKGGRRAKVSL